MMALLAGGLLFAWPSEVAFSHPLHSSYAEVTRDATGRITVVVRLFADDFGAALDSLRSLTPVPPVPIDSVARRYFDQSVNILAPTGAKMPTAWCGMHTQGNLTWVCGRTRPNASPGKFRLRNMLMFDRFQDQINIVRWNARTLVLSRRSSEALLE